jgi:hypothetical protein
VVKVQGSLASAYFMDHSKTLPVDAVLD